MQLRRLLLSLNGLTFSMFTLTGLFVRNESCDVTIQLQSAEYRQESFSPISTKVFSHDQDSSGQASASARGFIVGRKLSLLGFGQPPNFTFKISISWWENLPDLGRPLESLE